MSIWDRFQQQYENSAKEYENAVSLGASLLTQKGNMLQQNMMNQLGAIKDQASLALGLGGVEADKIKTFLNRMTDKETLGYNYANLGENKRQFGISSDLNMKQFLSDAGYKKGVLDQQNKEFDYKVKQDTDLKKEMTDAEETQYAGTNRSIIDSNPSLKSHYIYWKNKGATEKEITDYLQKVVIK